MTSLNTQSGGYNIVSFTLAKPFKDSGYSIVVCPKTDTGNIAGGEFKVTSTTATTFSVNYNHTYTINNNSMHFSYIAFGEAA